MAIARIHITLKPSLFDAQGATVLKALHQLGHTSARQASLGKYIVLELDETLQGEALQHELDVMCRQLLANPVIENYDIELEPGSGAIGPAGAAPPAASTASAPQPVTAGPAPTTRVAASHPSAGELKTLGGVTIAEPFAADYRTYQSLSMEERLSLRGVALHKHGGWILQQLNERRAEWILCIGGEVMDSGPTLDSYPNQERLTQLGDSNDLIPWVFTRPPK